MEVLELRFVMEYRFHNVWSRYRKMVSCRSFVEPECLNCYREDVFGVVAILRKLKRASLVFPAPKFV